MTFTNYYIDGDGEKIIVSKQISIFLIYLTLLDIFINELYYK